MGTPVPPDLCPSIFLIPCLGVTSAEDCDAKREFEQDCCELLISPFHYDQLVQDDIDVEEFVRSAFPEDTPLEKHMLVYLTCIGCLYLAHLNYK